MKGPDAVLALLKAQKDQHLSGEDIARKLRITRAAVWKDVRQLRALGYDIQAQPHLGYRLVSVPDRLFADEIREGLGTRVVGTRVFSYDELDSTNNAAFKLGESGAGEGACVFAEYQKKGRGRLGRSWVSPKNRNLMFSVLLRPDLEPADVPKLTLLAAVSSVKALRAFTGKPFGVKWPNDIYLDGRKAGGILTEMNAESERIHFVVIGIGLNVNSPASELPPGASSVREACGHPVSRIDLARETLRRLDEDYAAVREKGFGAVAAQWEEFSVTSGRRVTCALHGRRLEGQAVGIDEEGALWIRRDDGLQERVMTGDVSLV